MPPEGVADRDTERDAVADADAVAVPEADDVPVEDAVTDFENVVVADCGREPVSESDNVWH